MHLLIESRALSHRICARRALTLIAVLVLTCRSAFAYDALLRWTVPPEPGITDYLLYTGASSRAYGPGTHLGQLSQATVNGVVYSVYRNLQPGTSYFIAVTAMNAGQAESAYSNEKIFNFSTVTPPRADAGLDQNVITGNAVSLGTSPNAGISYFWEQVAGPTVGLSSRTASTTQFTALTAGTYQFILTAYDAGGIAAQDSVSVVASGGAAPTFTATPTGTPPPMGTATSTSTRTATATTTPGTPGAQLEWSTYLGGATPAATRVAPPQRPVLPEDTTRDVAVDAQGFIYVVGGTATLDFPHTVGPAHAGDMDAFITKFAPNGSLVWSRLIGGPNYDRAYGVEVSPNGSDVVICGQAGPNLPTQACPSCAGQLIDATFNGDNSPGNEYGQQDGWVGKVDSNGTLLWLSYYGDDSSDVIRDCDIDANGDVYVGHHGATGASNLGTPGTFRPTSYGGSGFHDALIAKLDRNGRSVLWATYLGGTGEDDVPSVRVHSDGTVYVAMDTSSTDFPLVNPVQSTLRGIRDYTLTRIAANGASLLFSTYLGGSGNTEFVGTHNLGLDGAGNAYLCAETDSTDFPGTAGFFQPANAGGLDHIFAKVKVTAPTAVLAATYVGGPGTDGEMSGCSVDSAGNVLATSFSSGSGSSYPTTAGAWQRINDGGQDAVLVQVASDFKSLRFASYLGGSGDDQGRSAFATESRLVTVGMSKSANFDVLNAMKPTHAENPISANDGFVAQFSLPTALPGSASATPTRTATSSSTPTSVPATSTPTPSRTATFTAPPVLTATPTRTNTMVATTSATPTRTATPSQTRTATQTPTATRTATQTSTPTRTSTQTATPTRTATQIPTQTSTPSRTATQVATAPFTPTLTTTQAPTQTLSPTRTPTAVSTQTSTPIPTATQLQTQSPTSTRSATQPPTQTATSTSTSTPVTTSTNPPASTATATPTPTRTVTPTNTPTYTFTPTQTASWTLTSTRTPAASSTPTGAAPQTQTPSATFPIATTTASVVPTATWTPTMTSTATWTPTKTATATDTPTESPSQSPNPTATRTDTATAPSTRTATATATPTETSTQTFPPSPTATVTARPTNTDTPEPTETPSRTPTQTAVTTVTPTATRVPTDTPAETPTPVETPTLPPTETLTPTAPATATPTATPVPSDTPADTPAPIDTPTPPPPTVPPTSTVGATATPTQTQLPTETAAETPTPAAGTSGLSGFIGYYGNMLPVSGVLIEVAGPQIVSVSTDSSGQFGVDGLTPDTWRIEPTKHHDEQFAISSLDAVYALQSALGMRTLNPLQQLACDVSGNGRVSTLDASLILKRATGQLESFPVADLCGSEWVFEPTMVATGNNQEVMPRIGRHGCQAGRIAYDSLNGHLNNQSFLAVLFGDCTGNWAPRTGSAGGPLERTRSDVRVRTGRMRHDRDGNTWLPVYVDTTEPVYAVNLQLGYAGAYTRALAVRTLATRQFVASELHEIRAGRARIGIASATPLQARGGATLIVVFEPSARRRTQPTVGVDWFSVNESLPLTGDGGLADTTIMALCDGPDC